MTKTDSLNSRVIRSLSDHGLGFGILVIVICLIFVICNLEFKLGLSKLRIHEI